KLAPLLLTGLATRTRYSPVAGSPPVGVAILKSPEDSFLIATSELFLPTICRPSNESIEGSLLLTRKLSKSSLSALRIISSERLPESLFEVLASSFTLFSAPKARKTGPNLGGPDFAPPVSVVVGLGAPVNSPVGV